MISVKKNYVNLYLIYLEIFFMHPAIFTLKLYFINRLQLKQELRKKLIKYKKDNL